ncbi:MAG: hypothetical protein GY757_02765, partial [bacterium]|nr:hypothetical protein [bacterium]
MNNYKKTLIAFTLFSLLCGMVSGTQVFPLPDLEKPDSITVSNDRLYFTDRGSVSVYNLNDMKLLFKFGRTGEGPGEFKISSLDKIGLRIAVTPK